MTRTCCFTGHRDLPAKDSDEYRTLSKALRHAVCDAIRLGCTDFYTGGAAGFDLLAAETLLRIQKLWKKSPMRLFICVPFLGHDFAFSAEDRARFSVLKEKATKVLYLSDRYTPLCFAERNRYMVTHSDVCIAYVRKHKSGSSQTLQMASKKRCILILL